MNTRIESTSPDSVLRHIGRRADPIVPLANGEPVTLLDAVEAGANDLTGCEAPDARLRDRPYLYAALATTSPHLLLCRRHALLP
jgi:hypothetical protein